jgi:general secretion pathway protein K
MMNPTALTTRRNPDGFIIVAVLWILGALSALVSIYSIYVIDTATAFAMQDDRIRAEALVSAGIELAAYHLTKPANSRPTNGRFDFRLEAAHVSVDFRSEAARVDLNAAPKELLTGLFATLGLRQDAAEYYADRIIRWRTTAPKQNADASGLREAEAAGAGGRFMHIREISLVPDLPRAIVERMLPFVTVYSGKPQVNIIDAAPEVVSSLPGMTRERSLAILTQRQSTPVNQQVIMSLLGSAGGHATTAGGNTSRVTVRVAFDNGRQTGADVVILMFDRGDEPYSVLSWDDDLDQSRSERDPPARRQ